MTPPPPPQLSASAEALSGMYAVLGRRRARILREELKEGSDTFLVRVCRGAEGTHCGWTSHTRMSNHSPSPPSSAPQVSCYLPAEASFGLADEMRRKSSGAASASLLLSHWERLQASRGRAAAGGRAHGPCCTAALTPARSPPTLPCPAVCVVSCVCACHVCVVCVCVSCVCRVRRQVDPFFVPTTEEEREELGEDGSGVTNLARRLVDAVRRRKVLRMRRALETRAAPTHACGTRAAGCCCSSHDWCGVVGVRARRACRWRRRS
jgi:translation elongation factor EF-G